MVETAESLFSFQISPRITRIDAHTKGLRIEPRIAQGGVFASLFGQGGLLPKKRREDARTPKVPRLPDETQRSKFAQAAKIFIESR